MDSHQALSEIVLLFFTIPNGVSRSDEMSFLLQLRLCVNTLMHPVDKLLIDTSIVMVKANVAAQVNHSKGLRTAKQCHDVLESSRD